MKALMIMMLLLPVEGAVLSQRLRDVRVKQEREEQTLQVHATGNVRLERTEHCSPIQQVRQQLRDIEQSDGSLQEGAVSIHAGHGNLNIHDNHGKIESNVQVQIIKPASERRCL